MSTFQQTVCLWLAPDFSAVERGEREPPYIDNGAINMAEIGRFLEDFNRCGETVRIRMADDTIDQVTVHLRMSGQHPGNPDCHDFSEELLLASKGSTGPVVAVSERWLRLHALKERDHAPPPIGLMFVVDGGFESTMLWLQQFKMRLGVKAADPMKLMSGTITDDDHQGHLPKVLLEFFADTFGIPYQRHCLVAQLARSPLPKWVSEPGVGRRSK